VQALERLWSEQLIVNTPQSDISAERSVVLDRIKRGLIRYSQFDREIEAIRFSDNIAIVMGSETIVRKVDAAETPKPVRRRFTNIWRQSTQGWRMIARHANVVPSNWRQWSRTVNDVTEMVRAVEQGDEADEAFGGMVASMDMPPHARAG
jgi:hypothetical protein